jgi:hypothetical protein
MRCKLFDLSVVPAGAGAGRCCCWSMSGDYSLVVVEGDKAIAWSICPATMPVRNIAKNKPRQGNMMMNKMRIVRAVRITAAVQVNAPTSRMQMR